MGKVLLLITTEYPLGGITERTFITPELKYLSERFSQIIIIPEKSGEQNFSCEFLNITVDYSRIKSTSPISKWLKIRFAINPYIARLLYNERSKIKSLRQALRTIAYGINILHFKHDMLQLISRRKLDPCDTLFYTFWFDFRTDGLALMNKKGNWHIITRAHGYDIYDRTFRPYHTRAYALSKIDKVYAASQNGADYIANRYTSYSNKITTSILGSIKYFPDKLSLVNDTSNVITFFSCARIAPEKRVHLNLEFLIAFAQSCPDKKVRWIHVGNGSLADDISRLISKGIPDNLKLEIKGAQPNSVVHDIYISETIDWTLLFSSSEGGLPITICESLSYGVPVIATMVGGIPEIINSYNGILLSKNPTATEFITKIKPYINDPAKHRQLKHNTYQYWQGHLNADKLRCQFADTISDFAK